MNRKEGYYWVKLKTEWRCAYWNPYQRHWYICGTPYAYLEKEFDTINETQILPPNN